MMGFGKTCAYLRLKVCIKVSSRGGIILKLSTYPYVHTYVYNCTLFYNVCINSTFLGYGLSTKVLIMVSYSTICDYI